MDALSRRPDYALSLAVAVGIDSDLLDRLRRSQEADTSEKFDHLCHYAY